MAVLRQLKNMLRAFGNASSEDRTKTAHVGEKRLSSEEAARQAGVEKHHIGRVLGSG